MNRQFYITRPAMLAALQVKELPRDESIGEHEVRVQTGYPNEDGPFIRLTVRVMPNGVANRIQAKCPDCETWMRFAGLKQHVGTMTCRKRTAEGSPFVTCECGYRIDTRETATCPHC